MISKRIVVISLALTLTVLHSCSKHGNEDLYSELESLKFRIGEKDQIIADLQLELEKKDNEIERIETLMAQQQNSGTDPGYLDIEFFEKPVTINELLIKAQDPYAVFPFGYAAFSGYYRYEPKLDYHHYFVITEGNDKLVEHLYRQYEEGNKINVMFDGRLAISLKSELSLVPVESLAKSSPDSPIKVMFFLMNYEWPEQDTTEGFEYARAITIIE